MAHDSSASPQLPVPDLAFSSDHELRRPGQFFRQTFADVRLALQAAPTLFQMQMKARHRASIFGALWIVLPMLGSAAIGLILQSHARVSLPSVGMPYPVYIVAGLTLWQIFMEALNLPISQLGLNRHGLTRLRMPFETALAAGLLELAMHTIVRLALLCLLLAVLGSTPGASMIYLPLVLIGLIGLGLTVGMVLAPLGLLVEDVGKGLLILGGAWFAISPVLYPSGSIDYLQFNPVTPLLNDARAALTGRPAASSFLAILPLLSLIPAWLLLRISRRSVVHRLA